MMDARVGLLGGTFDPIHEGHVAAALAAQQALGLDELTLVPSRQPPHRPEQPCAAAADRLAMATLVAREHAGWKVSDIEIRRDGPSYTFDTLTEFGKRGLSPFQIFFITGADAFAEIASWWRYPAVLDLAHFVVVARPGGMTLEALGKRLPELVGRMIPVGQFVPGPRLPAPGSRTWILLLETATPNVSSTEVRRRAHDGLPLAGMVSEAVAAHIEAHRLYERMKSER